MKRFAFAIWFVIFGLCACHPAATQETTPPQLLINSPAISMGVSREMCTSMEVQTGTQVTWTNDDTVTLSVSLTRVDEQGNETNISESEIEPGDSFSTQLAEAGAYRFYCSDDVYATISAR